MSNINAIAQALSTSTPSIASAATALAQNEDRMGYIIQNCGQNPLFVREGASASTTVFSYILAGGTANDNGTGGSFQALGPCVYSGVVTIAGTAPRYVATELLAQSS